jgi:hypothetical protein
LANGRQVAIEVKGPGDLAVNELVLAYLKVADGYYIKSGRPPVEPGNIRLAVRPLLRIYGHTPACKYSPLVLKGAS